MTTLSWVISILVGIVIGVVLMRTFMGKSK